ncbi:unnamed protein product, partial [Prorocentrum cordatum]
MANLQRAVNDAYNTLHTQTECACPVSKAHANLCAGRAGGGQGWLWGKFAAVSTTSEVTELFVGSDKKAATFYIDKYRGEISTNWRPLIKVTPLENSEEPHLEFAAANFVTDGIGQQGVAPLVL